MRARLDAEAGPVAAVAQRASGGVVSQRTRIDGPASPAKIAR
jgi:hypothetical protein